MSGGGPGSDPVTIVGQGIHSGAPAAIRLARHDGPLLLRAGGEEARIDEIIVLAADRASVATTRDGRLRIATVEHLFAALGAFSIRDGLVVDLEGPEIPLLDGGAATFTDALGRLALEPGPAPLSVERAGIIEVGTSRYELRPLDGRQVDVGVEVDFDDARIDRHASWSGDRSDFRERIATARTFAFAHEVEELIGRGLGRHVPPESVVLIAPARILSAGRPFASDEPARHKLLDLIGDLYAYGGPPRGSIRAKRPGHAATHEAIRRAIVGGLLVRT